MCVDSKSTRRNVSAVYEYVYLPVWTTVWPGETFFRSVYPDQPVFSACTAQDHKDRDKFHPASYVQAVQLLTTTTTRYADDGDLPPATPAVSPGRLVSTTVEPLLGTTEPTTAGFVLLSPGGDAIPQTTTTPGLFAPFAGVISNILPLPSPTPGPNTVHPAVQTLNLGEKDIPISPAVITTAQPGNSVPTTIAGIAIGGQTVVPGQTATVLGTPVVIHTSNGQTFAVAGTGAAAGTVPIKLSAPSPSPTLPALVIDGQTITAVLGFSPALVFSSQTLSLGSSISITQDGSTAIAALRTDKGNTLLLVGDQTSSLTSLPSNTPIIMGGHTIVPSGQTLTLGGSITVVNRDSTATAALRTETDKTLLIFGDQTSTLTSLASNTPILMNGNTINLVSLPAEITISGQRLQLGSSITVGTGPSAKTVTLTTNSIGKTILANGDQTVTMTENFLGGTPITASPPIVVGGFTFSPVIATALPAYKISGQILTMGGSIALGKEPTMTVLALTTDASGHLILASNGRTSTITGGLSASTDGAGSGSGAEVAAAIMSGIGWVLVKGSGSGSGSALSTNTSGTSKSRFSFTDATDPTGVVAASVASAGNRRMGGPWIGLLLVGFFLASPTMY
ncbi:hypothetical protein EJ08DRAFT_447913 [Tothia fuscella]|uniref:Uncharacterized protein n=1 Tax=Tothia fuscella TaxID=1048955 RepID=A0A9P4NJ24_9PEZI|nr:hypothetical protein EJ08DRAFT_447913 [Tothia fuscella]